MPSDILIQPNRGSTTLNPIIFFSGSAANNSIRLETLPSGSVAFLGKSGSLFSIVDSMSGSLMAVSDISGLPILEVFSDDRVVMGKFNKPALVVTGSQTRMGYTGSVSNFSNYALVVGPSFGRTGFIGISHPTNDCGIEFGTREYSNAGSWAKLFSDTSGYTGLLVSPGSLIGGGTRASNFPFLYYADATPSNDTLQLQSGGSTGLTIDGSQNVGIGKTAPINAKLDVNGTAILTGSFAIRGGLGQGNSTQYSSANRIIFDNDYNDSARGPNKIQLYDSNWLGGLGVHTSTLAYYSGDLHSWYQATNTSNAQLIMTANTTGLGIGKSPAAKLDVNGNAIISGYVTKSLVIGSPYEGTATQSMSNVSVTGSKQSLFSTDNMALSQLEGGAYFGRVGIKEDQWSVDLYSVGNTWTQKDSSRDWNSVAMSSDGKFQTGVVSSGYIYVSTDYGNTWTQKESSRYWRTVAMSSDGKIQTAVVDYGGYIYVSHDYGNTWTQKGTGQYWVSVAMSSDGKIQTAGCTAYGYVYVSSDYGNTWTQKDTGRYWWGLAMSSDGKIQTAATANSGYICVSTDYGNTWTQKDSTRAWYSVAMSSDGKIQTAVVYNGYIYVSHDYGNTWTQKDSTRAWERVAMSSDGKIQTAVVYIGYIYVSTDYGNTWTQKESSRYWYSIAMSSDGKIQTGAVLGGYIYVSIADSSIRGNAIISGSLTVGTGIAVSTTNGEIRAKDNITAYYSSDERLKTNIVKIDNSLEKIKQIDGVLFDWNDTYKKQYGEEDGYFIRKQNSGIIAQQVEKVFPNVVADRENGYKAVRYELLVPLLIEAIKEQQVQIDELKNKLK